MLQKMNFTVVSFILLQFFILFDQYGAQRSVAPNPPTTPKPTTSFPQETLPPHWGYKQVIDEVPPLEWQKLYPTCQGTRQSPIRIFTGETQLDVTLGAIDFSQYNQLPQNQIWTVLNNGHSVQLSANFTNPPEIQGGGLPSGYFFTQLHFHWGSSDSRGSEHRIDRNIYPLEMHIVHQKVSDTAAQSLTDSDGLAVISVLFALPVQRPFPNPNIDTLVGAIGKEVIPLQPVNVRLEGFNIAELLPNSQEYFRYLGSLTTPPCAEVVVWSVMKKPMMVTDKQLEVFRTLHDNADTTPGADNLLVDNNRPIQDPNARTVKFFSPTIIGK